MQARACTLPAEAMCVMVPFAHRVSERGMALARPRRGQGRATLKLLTGHDGVTSLRGLMDCDGPKAQQKPSQPTPLRDGDHGFLSTEYRRPQRGGGGRGRTLECWCVGTLPVAFQHTPRKPWGWLDGYVILGVCINKADCLQYCTLYLVKFAGPEMLRRAQST